MANANFYKGLTIQLGADSSGLDKALRQAQKQASGTYRELQQINRALKFDPSNTRLLVQQQENLKAKIKASTDELAALKAAEEQIGKENMSTEQWNRLQADIGKCEAYLKKYNQELAQSEYNYKLATTSAHDFGDKLERVGTKISNVGDKISTISGGISNFGDSYTQKVTAPIIGAAAAAVSATVTIDDALTSVRKTVDGTEEDYRALKDAAIEFSKTNAVSADQMLELDALGAQLGFALEELQKFGEVSSGLDIATDMSAEQAATEMAQFANITRMAHDDIDRYASTIVNLGNNLATTESKVSSMGQRIAAQGTQVKMSQADILGWSGAMTSLGIEAEAGGTAFSKTLAKIDMAVATGSDKLELFAKIAGKSVKDFSKAWNKDATGVMKDFLKGLNDAENMSVTLSELDFNDVRMSDALKRLAGNTDLVTQSLEYANKGWNENVALSEEVANKNSAISAKFEMLKNKVVAVANSVGEPLSDALMNAIDAAEPLIKMIENGADAFNKMSREEQQQVMFAVGAVAALGPLLSIAGRTGDKIGSLVTHVGNAVKSLKTFAHGLGEYNNGIREVEGVSSNLTKSMKLLHGGLIAVGIAAAAAITIGIINLWKDYQQQIETARTAALSFEGMEQKVKDRAIESKDALKEAGEGAIFYRDKLAETKEGIQGLIEKQAEANTQFMSSLKDFNVDSTMLGTYMQTIETLANHDLPLTAEQQAELNVAVQGYNDITGGSLEIIDKQTGKLSQNTTEIWNNTRAYLAQAEIEVYQERIKKAIEERMDAEELLKEAQDKLTESQNNLSDAISKQSDTYDVYGTNVAMAEADVRSAEQAVKDIEGTIKDCNDYIAEGSKKITDIELRTQNATEATNIWSETVNQLGKDVKESMNKAGWSTNDFAQKCIDAGLTTEEMKKITSKQFEEMYVNAKGDMDKIIESIKEVNKQQFDKKKLEFDPSDIDLARKKWEELKTRIENNSIKGKILLESLQVGGAGPAGTWGKHAAGGIFTSKTYTSNGIVGEAGAEALVPIENPRYIAPFAKAVAQQMANITNTKQTINQVNLDGVTINDDKAMEKATEDYLYKVMRKAGMNRG